MIRTLIVDDEALARGLVREYLQAHDDIEIVAECDNGFDAVKTITELRPDLIFLDIQMPRLSGLEVLELTQRDHGVIFTTAYDQHALKAFDLRAVDYLLKPFAQARFDEALMRARALLGQASTGVRALAAQPVGKLERLLVRERNQVFVLALDTVACVEAQDDYIQIYCPGKTYLKTQSLSDLETLVDHQSGPTQEHRTPGQGQFCSRVAHRPTSAHQPCRARAHQGIDLKSSVSHCDSLPATAVVVFLEAAQFSLLAIGQVRAGTLAEQNAFRLTTLLLPDRCAFFVQLVGILGLGELVFFVPALLRHERIGGAFTLRAFLAVLPTHLTYGVVE